MKQTMAAGRRGQRCVRITGRRDRMNDPSERCLHCTERCKRFPSHDRIPSAFALFRAPTGPINNPRPPPHGTVITQHPHRYDETPQRKQRPTHESKSPPDRYSSTRFSASCCYIHRGIHTEPRHWALRQGRTTQEA